MHFLGAFSKTPHQLRAADGDTYFNTSKNQLMVFVNHSWKKASPASYVVVGGGNSPNPGPTPGPSNGPVFLGFIPDIQVVPSNRPDGSPLESGDAVMVYNGRFYSLFLFNNADLTFVAASNNNGVDAADLPHRFGLVESLPDARPDSSPLKVLDTCSMENSQTRPSTIDFVCGATGWIALQHMNPVVFCGIEDAATDVTVRPDGSSLMAGDTYIKATAGPDSTRQELMVFNGDNWINAAGQI